MCQHGVFDVPEIKLPTDGELEVTQIRLHLLQHDRMEPEGYPISGALCSRVMGTSLSSDPTFAPEISPVKGPFDVSELKAQIKSLDQLKDGQGRPLLATAALLENTDLQFSRPTTTAHYVFGNQKLPIREIVDAVERPPPYGFSMI
jgi:hypothetical protein